MNCTQEQLRKIDALVAEHIMGLEVLHSAEILANWNVGEDGCVFDPEEKDINKWCKGEIAPMYSTDIVAAWEIMNKFDDIKVSSLLSHGKFRRYVCIISEQVLYPEENIFIASGDEAPLAICLAALKAKGIDVEKAL